MSLATEVFKTQYTTNGVTTAFAIDFTALNEQDVLVTVLLDADTMEEEKVLTTDYTINAGRTSVEMLTAPAAGKLTVSRRNRKIQNYSWPVGGPFSEESLNDGLDFRAMTNFEVWERLNRCMELQINDDDSVDMRLPLKAARASKFLAFDADSIPIASSGGASVPVSTFMATFVDDLTAAAGLTTLGFSTFIQTLIDDVNSAEARATLEIREVAAGGVQAYAGASAPTGYLLCDGSAVSRTTYADLFAAISTTWGVGDGSTTFNLPDLRETALVGVGSTGETVGAHDALALAEFSDDQFEEHNHTIGYQTTGTPGTQNALMVGNAETGTSDVFARIVTSGRVGTTTHGKIIGVNHIIKY